jgi:peptide deformylase
LARLKVVQYPDPVLLKRTQPVESIGDWERAFVLDMIETMHEEAGVGLAANQVGVSKRIFVACADGVKGKELVYFNPEIIAKSGEIKDFEGCLSVRDEYEPVTRYREVTLRAMNLDGQTVEVKAKGLLARIFQHEVDHLDGFVFVHRLGWLKRRKIFKKFERSK